MTHNMEYDTVTLNLSECFLTKTYSLIRGG